MVSEHSDRYAAGSGARRRRRGGKPKRRARQPEIEPPDKRTPKAVLIVAGIAALNSANLGYDIGVMAGAALRVQDDWSLSDVKVEVLVGILNACAIAGAAVAHYVVDRLGRRRTFTVSSAVFIVGVLGMACSVNYAMFIYWLLQVITGLGVGVGLSVDPVYIAEVAPPHARGALVSWSEIAINVGILLGFVAAWCFADVGSDTAWRAMLALGAILPSVLFVLTLTVMPEPRRLVHAPPRPLLDGVEVVQKAIGATRSVHEARRVLARLGSRDGTLEEIQAAVAREADQQGAGWGAVFKPKDARRPARDPRRRRRRRRAADASGRSSTLLPAAHFIGPGRDAEPGLRRARGHVRAQDAVYRRRRDLLGQGREAAHAARISGCGMGEPRRRVWRGSQVFGMGLSLLVIGTAFSAGLPVLAVVATWSYMMSFSLGIGPGCWLVASGGVSTGHSREMYGAGDRGEPGLLVTDRVDVSELGGRDVVRGYFYFSRRSASCSGRRSTCICRRRLGSPSRR